MRLYLKASHFLVDLVYGSAHLRDHEINYPHPGTNTASLLVGVIITMVKTSVGVADFQ